MFGKACDAQNLKALKLNALVNVCVCNKMKAATQKSIKSSL